LTISFMVPDPTDTGIASCSSKESLNFTMFEYSAYRGGSAGNT
jgi:hypothetical protein